MIDVTRAGLARRAVLDRQFADLTRETAVLSGETGNRGLRHRSMNGAISRLRNELRNAAKIVEAEIDADGLAKWSGLARRRRLRARIRRGRRRGPTVQPGPPLVLDLGDPDAIPCWSRGQVMPDCVQRGRRIRFTRREFLVMTWPKPSPIADSRQQRVEVDGRVMPDGDRLDAFL